MTPLPPRPLKAPGWMTSCLARPGRRKHTQVTNELHQTPRVSLSSISSLPNPGRRGGCLQGKGLWTPPSSPGPPGPWLSALPPTSSTGTLGRSRGPRGGAGSKRLPLGPDRAVVSLWPGTWVADSDSGGHAGRHTGNMLPPPPWLLASDKQLLAAAPAPRHLPRLPCPLGPECDKGPPQQEWTCLPSGRAT